MIDMNADNASDVGNAVIHSNTANEGDAVNTCNNRIASINSMPSKSRPQKGISIGFVKLGRRPIRSDDPKASQYGTSPSGTFRPLSVLVPLHIKSGRIAHFLAGSEDARHVP